MKPLPTWEEIASRVTVREGVVRVVDLRKAIGANATMRITGLAGGVISLEQLRSDHRYATTTETLRGASIRVGVSLDVLRRALMRGKHISIHDGRKGMRWHRIPIGVADRIAADRREEAGAQEAGSLDAARLAAPRRRHAPVRGVPEAFDRLADALLGEDPEPEADDLSTVEGCRAALRSASFAAMIAAHDLADCDGSMVAELEADLAEHRAREEAARVALRALRGVR